METVEFETQLIGSMLIKGDHVDCMDIAAKLPAEAFSNAYLRDMYLAICSLLAKCEPVDIFMVRESVHESTREHVMNVAKNCSSAANIKAWAKKVRQGWLIREATQKYQEAINLLSQANPSNINEMVTAASTLTNSVRFETNDRLPRRLSDILPDWMDTIEKRMEGEESGLYLKIGIDPLDEKYGGFDRTDLIVIAGSPGSGKTELAIKIANSIGKNRHSGLFISMEMSEIQIADRHVADCSGLPMGVLRNPGDMTDEDYARMGMAVQQLNTQDNYVLDATMGVDEILSHAERMVMDQGLGFLAIDYLGLIPKGKAERNDLAIADITRKLKNFSLKFKVPVILLSQLNRNVAQRADKRPIIQDLKDASSIEADADVIIFPYRDEVHNPESHMKGIAEIIVRKYRSGEPTTAYMGWRNGHFVNIDQEEAARQAAFNEAESSKGGDKRGGWRD